MGESVSRWMGVFLKCPERPQCNTFCSAPALKSKKRREVMVCVLWWSCRDDGWADPKGVSSRLDSFVPLSAASDCKNPAARAPDCSTPNPRTTTLARCTRSGWIACLSVVGEVMMKFAVWQEPAKQREDRGQRHFSQSCLARGRPGCWMPKHSKLKSPPVVYTLDNCSRENLYAREHAEYVCCLCL